jgi:hypothetical protein
MFSGVRPVVLFESPATLVRLLMDLRFYPPLLVSLRLRWCLSWSGVERLLLSDTSYRVYIPRVLNFHFSMSFLSYMEMSHWCFIACFDWVDTLRSGCPNVGIGRCWGWVSCTYTVETVRVVGIWVRFRTEGDLGLLRILLCQVFNYATIWLGFLGWGNRPGCDIAEGHMLVQIIDSIPIQGRHR